MKSVILFVITAVQFISVRFDEGEPLDSVQFRADLRRIEQCRNGRKTVFRDVDRLAQEMLEKYADPPRRGLIYFTVAHVYSQSGMSRPVQTVEYIKKALDLPLDTEKRLILHVYWGDAIRVTKEISDSAERRRQAAAAYLFGVYEVVKLKLPATAPDVPMMSFSDFGGDAVAQAEEDANTLKAAEAQRLAIFQRDMIRHREVLMGQLIEIYKRPPDGRMELKELADNLVGDALVTEALLNRIGEIKTMKGNGKSIKEENADPRRRMWLWGMNLVVVAVGVFFIFRWERSQR
ncbi:MAG: hypothetical protein WCJ09_12610 [Planctomycetota bacterium]